MPQEKKFFFNENPVKKKMGVRLYQICIRQELDIRTDIDTNLVVRQFTKKKEERENERER